MLKPDGAYRPTGGKTPAAFRRLCVETLMIEQCALLLSFQPPSGGCVLKFYQLWLSNCLFTSAAFGWLYVQILPKQATFLLILHFLGL